jgi:hypothetical protein
MPTITARNSPAGIANLLRTLALALAGKNADPTGGMIRTVQVRMGLALMSEIKLAFIEKAAGGVGSDGIKWQPLKRSTIAQRRTTGDERRSLGVTGAMVHRGLLTAEQDKRWRKIFASRKAMLMVKFGMGDKESSARAAQIAWTILKQEGAKTKLEVYGGRHVLILRDTGELLNSFSPGVDGPGPGGILRTPSGRIIVGTSKKPWHHAGTKNLPARPYWPPDGNLPQSWWATISGAGNRGLLEIVAWMVKNQAV